MTKKKETEQDLAKLFDGVIDTAFDVTRGAIKTGVRAVLTLKDASDAVEDGRAEAELKRGKEQFEEGLRRIRKRAKSMIRGFLDEILPDEKNQNRKSDRP